MPAVPDQFSDVAFPVMGTEVTSEYQQQRDATTHSGVNVRSFEMLTGRCRGGSRPGLVKFLAEPLAQE